MIKLLTKFFVKDSENTKDAQVRAAYGNMSGIVGIFLNLCLFAVKLLAGIVSASISVIADAFNNLSDAGSSVVTYLGFKLARRPADREHPFGHGRYEYVTGLGISVVILLVGVELLKSSVSKIFAPEEQTSITLLSIIILAVSVIVKLWMFFSNKAISKKINSSALKATAVDSLSDCVATSIVLIGLIVSKFSGFNIDGWLGALVAVFILFAGVSTFRESLSPLLGNPPDAEFVNEIKNTVMQSKMVVGIHDLIVHDYGPGRCIISLHAEVPCNVDILKAHDEIDLVEKELERRYNCLATIHMDPIASDDEYTLGLKQSVSEAVKKIDDELTIHDFRIVKGDTHTNVIFDLVVPYDCQKSEDEIKTLAKQNIQKIDQKLMPVIYVERSFVE